MRRGTYAIGRIAAGLVAFTVLAALLVGLPWLLVTGIGWPLPHHLPTVAEITTALTNPIDDQTLLNILAVLAWLLWAQFVRDVIAEIFDALHDITSSRRDPHRRPRPARSAGGPVRIAAAVLVGAITAAILLDSARTLTRPSTAAAAAPQPRPAATAQHPAPDQALPTEAQRGSTASPATATTTHTAVPPQARPADPAITPINTTTPTTPPTPAWARNAPGGTYQVRAGDDLWDIARQHLGDPNRWREIYTASRHQPQPDGDQLTDPAFIRPGWILALPAPTANLNAAAPKPPASDPPTPAPRSEPSGQDSATRPHPHAETATHAQHHAATNAGITLPTGAWITLGLATALATTATTAALYRRHRARLRWPIPTTSTATPNDIPESLLAAINTAAAEHHDDEAPPPVGPPAAVAVDHDGAEIGLEALTTNGLALTGPGTHAATRALLAAALTEGTLADPTQRITLIATTDLLSELLPDDVPPDGIDPHHRSLDGERLHLLPDTDKALARFEQEMLYRQRLTTHYDLTDPTQADEAHAELATTGLTLLVATTTPEHTTRIHAVLAASRHLRLGAIVWTDSTALPGLNLDADGTSNPTSPTAPPIARIATLGPSELADTLHLVRSAAVTHDDPDPEPGDDPQDADPAPEPMPPPASDTPALVHLAVLGPTTVSTANGTTTELHTAGHAILAYLAAHPHGVTRDQALDQLYPNIEPTAASGRFRTACTGIRTALHNATGHHQEHFIVYEQGRYRLDSDTIDVDLWRMLTALNHANHATNDADTLTALQQAADTYHGDFANGLTHTWVLDHATTYRRQAIDALARIAEIHELDNPDAALAALNEAVDHDPICEELYQRIMRIEGRLGRVDAVRRTLQRCTEQLEAIQTEPSNQTRRIAARQLRRPAA